MLRSSVLAVGLCSSFAFVLPGTSACATTRVLTYNVESPTFGTIGTYTNTVSERQDSADVRTDLHVAVKVLGIRLFHEDATRDERWQRQRLVAFQSHTDDNGTVISVDGQAEGEHFVIHSTSDGTLTAPAGVHPSNPWAPFLLQDGTMMSTRTGRLTSVVVKDLGDVTATFDGRAMRVRQWFVDGAKHQVVWIDGRGVIVAFETQDNGHPITFVLTSETAGSAATATPR